VNRFDKAAASWDTKPSSLAIAKACVENIKKHIDIEKNINILDYGCGTGLVAIALSSEYNNVLGMDYSKGMVDTFNQKIEKLNYNNIKAIQHNINNEDLPKNSFDLITTSMTLHHIEDTDMFIQKCKLALKKDGHLCINDLEKEDGTFHSKHKNDGVSHFGFEKADLSQLLIKNGFVIVDYKTVLIDKRNDKQYPIFNIIAKT
jgi:ubiquinone/menaquinone biosynthesis C-methylase UbiE